MDKFNWEENDIIVMEDKNMPMGKWTPPEAGDAPKAVKNILAAVYSEMRDKWAKEHPEDIENAGNKSSAAQQAWGAVKNAGWEKNKEGKWTLKEAVYNPLTGSFDVSSKVVEATPGWVSMQEPDMMSSPMKSSAKYYPSACVFLPKGHEMKPGAQQEMTFQVVVKSVEAVENGDDRVRLELRAVSL